jgi:threonine/homoserine/homoserine lactone efflux protein
MLEIFGISFLMGLTGALQPGPLLTFTVISTIKNKTKKAWFTGAVVVLGHAILEISLVIAILLGLSTVLSNIILIRIVGTIGGALLIYFGISTFQQLKRGVDLDFEKMGAVEFSSKEADSVNSKETKKFSFYKMHPITGGIVISLSNPYWMMWWVFVGLGVMINYSISLANPLGVGAFFFGHISADLVWYLFISILISLGSRSLNTKIYGIVMLICGIFMIAFGIYLMASIQSISL